MKRRVVFIRPSCLPFFISQKEKTLKLLSIDGDAKAAAKTLGMQPITLRHRMEKLGIKRSAHRLP